MDYLSETCLCFASVLNGHRVATTTGVQRYNRMGDAEYTRSGPTYAVDIVPDKTAYAPIIGRTPNRRQSMPSGPAHLHLLFGDDWNAWVYLRRRGFTNDKGIASPPWQGHKITEMEEKAIDYLFMEWDWCYNPLAAPETPPERSMLLSWRAWALRVLSGPLRVRDKHLRSWQMWWYCAAKYELRRRWYYITGRRDEWDNGKSVI